MVPVKDSQVFLIFGNGWIANLIKDLLKQSGKTVVTSLARIENREQVLGDLTLHKPTRVINCAGIRGFPNVDWCEDNKAETMRSNVLGVMNVVDCCFQLGIHITQVGSACIYDRDIKQSHLKPFTEADEPNYAASWYSRSRLIGENAITHYPNLLLLRIRTPVAADLDRNNLISKLINYDKLLSVSASGSVLPNLLPGAIILSEKAETGIYNLISPEPFTNNEIMELVKKHVRPSLSWENFELADQEKVLKAPRCNPIFDSTKLVSKLAEYGYQIKSSHDALEDMVIEMKNKGIR
ncbi:epimerase/hydratase [Xylariomycetidae sp. FL2044]|nr:epimerase/hydratase [Xylariomycetidae sp. FL2044]